jgi:hypothetical protein
MHSYEGDAASPVARQLQTQVGMLFLCIILLFELGLKNRPILKAAELRSKIISEVQKAEEVGIVSPC